MTIYIGVTGEDGAGKGSVIKFMIEEFDGRMNGVSVIKFADLLGETLALWGLGYSRANLQVMAQVMDEKFGDGTLTRAIEKRVLATPSDVVIIDGVCWWSDFELIRRLSRSSLLYVTATADRRFAQVSRCAEKPDEVGMTREVFDANEKSPNVKDVPAIGARADYKIVNDCAWGELHGRAEDVAKDILRRFV